MTSVNDQTDSPPVVGILAEFDGPEALKAAAAGLRGGLYSLRRFQPLSRAWSP